MRRNPDGENDEHVAAVVDDDGVIHDGNVGDAQLSLLPRG